MNNPVLEIQALTTAAQLYEDDLLPGLYDDWLMPLREDFRSGSWRCCTGLQRSYEVQQQYAAALPWAERLVAMDSLSRRIISC